MNRLVLGYGLVAMITLTGSAWGQGSGSRRAQPVRRQPPPKMTESQAKSAEPVTVDQEAVAKFVVQRPAIAVDGKDLVALVDAGEIVDGSTEHSSTFDSQEYRFANADHKSAFDQNPEKYVPALGGYSVVAFKNEGRLIPGSAEHRAIAVGELFLFASNEEKEAFEAAPESFETMGLIMEDFSVVSLVEEETLRPGEPKYAEIFNGHRLFFASELEKNAFLSDPGLYFPTLGGIDIVALAEGKVVAGSAKFGAVFKNRLYLFSSADTRAKFLSQAEPYSDLDVANAGMDPVAPNEKGHYAITAIYRGKRYLFMNHENRTTFLSDPAAYVKGAAGEPSSANADESTESVGESSSDAPSEPAEDKPTPTDDEDPIVKEPERVEP